MLLPGVSICYSNLSVPSKWLSAPSQAASPPIQLVRPSYLWYFGFLLGGYHEAASNDSAIISGRNSIHVGFLSRYPFQTRLNIFRCHKLYFSGGSSLCAVYHRPYLLLLVLLLVGATWNVIPSPLVNFAHSRIIALFIFNFSISTVAYFSRYLQQPPLNIFFCHSPPPS